MHTFRFLITHRSQQVAIMVSGFIYSPVDEISAFIKLHYSALLLLCGAAPPVPATINIFITAGLAEWDQHVHHSGNSRHITNSFRYI